MAKDKVIILEDDSQLALAMSQAIASKGFEVLVTERTNEVREILKDENVKTIFVDCLLPTDNGVDFITSIRKDYPANTLDVVLMSGLFTDNQFIRESLKNTKAIAFLKKPFPLHEALSKLRPTRVLDEPKIIPNQENSQIEILSPRKALYSLFGKEKVSNREKLKAIEALEEIHGFDLAYIYSLLAETSSTGHLNIINSNGEISGITFCEGHIIGVDVVDQETFLGKMMIEAGYILPDDLNLVLNSPNPKKIGEIS